MSEFIKKLERISREKAQPLGFGGIARNKSSAMMLIGQLPQAQAGIGNSISEEVDALLFDVMDSNGLAEALSKEAIVPVPWGIRLGTADLGELAKLADAGCDYLVFKPEVPARIVAEERMGKVLEVDTSLGDSLARAIGQIPLEAILLRNDEESSLSVQQLLDYQRLIALAGTLPIALLPADISDLEALWGIGVRGLVIDVSTEDRHEKLAMVKEAIRKLPASRRKPQERISPILPTVQALDEEFEEGI
ncbi:hypothetical protein M1N81_02080 [Dehalococcoidia bacterium]|nr:hypothetical protein [Dehalococcoidia bacterium]